MFNEICINEEMLPKHTYIHIYIYIYIYIYINIYIYIYILSPCLRTIIFNLKYILREWDSQKTQLSIQSNLAAISFFLLNPRFITLTNLKYNPEITKKKKDLITNKAFYSETISFVVFTFNREENVHVCMCVCVCVCVHFKSFLWLFFKWFLWQWKITSSGEVPFFVLFFYGFNHFFF